MLILGYGNPDRGDDAVGLLIIDRLRQMGIPAQTVLGDGLQLVEAWKDAEDVLLVDAVVAGDVPGAILIWEARDIPLSFEPPSCSSHGFGVAEAIRLSRILERLPKRLRICGIEASQFEPGANPSPAVLAAVESAALKIAAEWAASQASSFSS